MARRIVPLTLDRFAAIGAPCRDCLFWEYSPVARRSVRRGREPLAKQTWLSEVLREWGSCGRVVMVDERAAGYIAYVPPRFAPGAESYPTAPVSPGAVLMTTIWLDPAYAGGGLGRMLVQAMAADLVPRKIRAVEAFGDVGPVSRIHGQRCSAPAGFLAAVGFKTHRAHPSAPRLRMDLRQAITWRDEVGTAWDRLVEAVRPQPSPGRVGGSGAREADAGLDLTPEPPARIPQSG